jgi:hypothetical protein
MRCWRKPSSLFILNSSFFVEGKVRQGIYSGKNEEGKMKREE